MVILELALTTYGIVGTTASVIGGIDLALKRFSKITAEGLFKKCFVNTVKECASSLAGFTETRNPETIGVDTNKLDSIIASLKDTDIAELRSLKESEKLTKITAHFRGCISLPNHQLTNQDLDQKLRPVFEKIIINFYRQLPFKQEAFNQIALEFIQNSTTNQAEAHALLRDLSEKIEKIQLEVQERLVKDIQTIKDDTNEIKETTQTTLDVNREMLGKVAEVTDTLRHLSISIPDAVAEERQSAIDDARNLLNNYTPKTALNLLKALKQRSWANASTNLKFNILTNMAAAQYAINKERKAAKLLIRAFKHNPKDERALANRALAHLLLGEIKKATDYAKQTLQKNSDNVDAYAILIGSSTDEETLEEIIDKVPKHLQKTSQIAYAISSIAKQRGNLEEAKKWREIMVLEEQEDGPDFKAALAAILIEQVLINQLTVVTKQFDKAQKKQLQQAIELLTEAWDCVSRTELRDFRVGWIINRGMAYFHLGEMKETINDLDTALEIEPLNPDLLKKRAISAFEDGERESAIEFLEKIQSTSEVPEVPIILANFLFAINRFEEAITKLNDFLTTNPSSELQKEANHLLISVYIAHGCFTEAQQISRNMHELDPTNILYLVDAARISSATGERDEALSLLREAYDYAQNSEEFPEIVELADQLYIQEQFKEAATLYEKLADTNQNSELTRQMLQSYYNAGEIGKVLEVCRELREKYGPIKNLSRTEYEIYEEIGDLNKALAVCEAYIDAFPEDTDMQMHLAYVHHRLNNFEEFDRLLDKSFDLKNLSLQSHFNLAHLHRIGSKPEKALKIMYEARRTYFNDADAHLKYFGLFLQVEKQIGELLHPTQVQSGTAVGIDSSGEINWYIIENRDETDYRSEELDVEHPLAQRLLGKTVKDKICLQENPIDADVREIADIKSKYVYAFQDTFRKFSERFPGTPGLWSIELPDSHATNDSAQFQPLLDFIDQQHEATLQIVKVYKENELSIGALTNLIGGNILDTWGFLMSSPDLGIRCCAGNSEERIQALALLENPQLKLVVDLISLITLHCLEAADIVVRAFGKLCIAQSTIDDLQGIINEREGMWSKREGMTVRKQGDQYVKQIINPENAKHGIEYLKGIVEWIKENCEVEPCTPALEMNQLDKRELNDMLQPLFIDTLLIANQPDYLLLSDDAHLRFDGVWTQVVLGHCVNKGLLNKAGYDKMTIKLVCSHYYHTEFNSDVLIEAAKQSDWKPAEPYNSLVQVLGGQRSSLGSALNVTADFLCELWEQPILHHQSEYLTQVLLKELTSNRKTREVLILLAEQIQKRFTLYLPVEERILEQIEVYAQKHPF